MEPLAAVTTTAQGGCRQGGGADCGLTNEKLCPGMLGRICGSIPPVCAIVLNGEPWAISQVADRIDGKATAEIQTEQRHRYVVEVPPQLSEEEWVKKILAAQAARNDYAIAWSARGNP